MENLSDEEGIDSWDLTHAFSPSLWGDKGIEAAAFQMPYFSYLAIHDIINENTVFW